MRCPLPGVKMPLPAARSPLPLLVQIVLTPFASAEPNQLGAGRSVAGLPLPACQPPMPACITRQCHGVVMLFYRLGAGAKRTLGERSTRFWPAAVSPARTPALATTPRDRSLAVPRLDATQ